MIRTKRAYEPPATADGQRYLVDRLWPRGLKKEKLRLDGWLKNVAPSDELRKWFHHDPQKWAGFQKRYRTELEERPDAWKPLLNAAQAADLTLLFSAHDSEHNNAVVLKSFLNKRLRSKR